MPDEEYIAEQKLTVKQQKFVEGYVRCGNATQAAKDANYSESAARQIGSENLSKPYINRAIEKYASEAAAKANITGEMVLSVLKKWLYEFDKPAASIKAAELLGKHLKLFETGDSRAFISHEQVLKELEKLKED